MNNNCLPPMNNPLAQSQGGVAAYLAELLKLSPAQVRGTVIELMATLGATNLIDTDEYRVPSDQDLVIFQAHAAYRSSALNTEPALNVAITALGVADLALARASNVTVQLRDKDRNLDVFDQRAVNMAGIMPPNGSPIFWPAQAPFLMPSGHTFQATFSAQSAVAAVIGNDADYSVLLTGVLIPKRL